jgi:acetaldehyde dehydrogenase (acetylating)
VADIMAGKTFDNGVLCSSPNSVVVDGAVEPEVRREFVRQGGHFLSAEEAARLASVLVTPQRLPNPKLVGKTAAFIAREAGLTIPDGTRVLLAVLDGVGRDFPLSIEKLAPVLSYYVVSDWREGCDRCIQILRYGGMGHSMSIHSRNEQVILEFGLKKPAFRIMVNTPTTHGSIGLSTGLDPSMTLGCGGYGGNITSDNITPRHLLNIKRLAYETRPVATLPTAAPPGRAPLPRTPAPLPPAPGVAAAAIRHQVDSMVAARAGEPSPDPPGGNQPEPAVVDFVCEEDVRQAMKTKRTILVGEKTIITPAARDMAEAHRVFVRREWPR